MNRGSMLDYKDQGRINSSGNDGFLAAKNARQSYGY